jgi:hypothetical protein
VNWRRPKFLFPLAFTSIFVVFFAQVESRSEECASEPGRVCFPYPQYLPFHLFQGIDAQRLLLTPLDLIDLAPDSVTPNYPTRAARFKWTSRGAAIACVALAWFAIGYWWERLNTGRRTSVRTARGKVIASVFMVFGSVAALAIYSGMRGGYEGPTATLAAIPLPLLLALMTTTELGWTSMLMKGRRLGIVIGIAMALLCLFAFQRVASEWLEYQSAHCDSDEEAVCFQFPFVPSPNVMDMLAFPGWLPLIASAIGFGAGANTAVICLIAAALTGLLWFALLSAERQKRPRCATLFPVIRNILLMTGILGLIIGLVGSAFGSHHAPMGSFGLLVGSCLQLVLLRRTK